MKRIQAVKGTRDIFFPEIEEWQRLEEEIRNYFSKFLYTEIRTPIFEYTELFFRGIGEQTEVVQKEMYTFLDKGGRSITLRPENTASVVRAIVENNLLEKNYPAKYFYIGPMFRYDKPQKGRLRQFHQFGVEILGVESALCDAELIFAAVDFLKKIDLENGTLLINSVGCKECRPAYSARLQEAAFRVKEELCPDCQRRAEANPLRIFDCKNASCIAISESLPKISDHLCAFCKNHFEQLKELLQVLGVEFKVEPRLVRGLDYYTRTTFEIVCGFESVQNAVLGGGRYNDLIRELGGPDIGAIGFAAGMERILLNLKKPLKREQKVRKVFIAYQSEFQKAALQLGEFFWSRNKSAIVAYETGSLKKQLSRAAKAQADFTIIIGEDEVQQNKLTIKDMQSGQQIRINQEELDRWVQDWL